jgi:hypothetical protein
LGCDKLACNSRLLSVALPRPGFLDERMPRERVCLASSQGAAATASKGIRTSRAAEGGLVRRSLHLEDVPDVQRGECSVWMVVVQAWGRCRDSSAADALQPYDSGCKLNTTATSTQPRRLTLAMSQNRLDSDGYRLRATTPESSPCICNGKGALIGSLRCCWSSLFAAPPIFGITITQSPCKPRHLT